jgi:bifunctional non-homologous end joining protein LigD
MPRARRTPVSQRSTDVADAQVRSRAVVRRKPPHGQEELFAPPAPMPERVEPCLPTLVPKAPSGDDWLHEVKWDGYRIAVHIEGQTVTVLTRGGFDWTGRFPRIVAAARELGVAIAIIDGEACVLDEKGLPSFGALQAELARGAAPTAALCAFDLAYLDGRDLRELPLEERREALGELIDKQKPGAILFSEAIAGDGPDVYHHACGLGLEGIVSKRRGSPYRSGRRREWLKTKCTLRDEFVVVGYQPSEAMGGQLGKLRVAWRDEAGELHFAGGVGTGFTARIADALVRRLESLRIPKPIFRGLKRPGAIWTRPELVVEIEYRGWTEADGRLRHAAYKGMRDDRAADDIEPPSTLPPRPAEEIGTTSPWSRKPVPNRREPSRGGVPRENILQLLPDAVVPTHEELKAYWRKVGKRALKYLGGRPLKLVRHDKGATFFHKGPLPEIPPAVRQLTIEEREGGEGVRVWVDSVEGLLGLVDMGVVEVHPWGAKVDDIEHPDTLVFDLDPGEGIEWDFLVETALELRDLLEHEEDLPSWPKLSGGNGIHLMVPFDRGMNWDKAHAYAKRIAQRMASTAPKVYTTSATAQRAGKLFIDWLRNGRGATAVGAYSPRAQPGFPVAAPVTWRDVERGMRPDALTIQKVPRR